MSNQTAITSTEAAAARCGGLLALLAGAVFGAVLVKLGSPVVLAGKIIPPADLREAMIMSWPLQWGYGLLGLFILAAVALAWKLPVTNPSAASAGRWIVWVLAAWLAWQLVSALQTVDVRLTRWVLPHFFACGACFLAGRFLLVRSARPEAFWLVLTLALTVTLVAGFEQHFGGLEQTRKQFEQLPEAMRATLDTPEFRARMASNRIFSTFFYPNAFAGGILLLLPGAMALVWRWSRKFGIPIGAALTGVTGLPGLACLYWSGSKAGWLIALLMGLVVLWLTGWSRRWKVAVTVVLLAAGLAGFFTKYADYFARGATSAGARLDYWRAAWTAFQNHPLTGTGPGTFSVVYKQLKPPEAEMTHLAHNDYLQQACDSGLVGGAAYAIFVVGMLLQLRPVRWSGHWRAAAWLGVLGWAMQSTVEFGLYIPALAWLAFLLLGWLRATRTEREATP